jgi:crossover junction endodeoxyribonuclease RuvC
MATVSVKNLRVSHIVGIDPGKNGGIAVLSRRGKVLVARRMPDTVDELAAFVATIPEESKAFVEFVRSTPQMGVVSAFTFGCGLGKIEGVFAAFRMPLTGVRPQKWQDALGCRSGGDKNVTKRKAAKLFPRLVVTHAIADALLIAEHGRRLEVGTVRGGVRA